MNNYNFELLVKPEEFKQNKKRHRKMNTKAIRINKIKIFISYVIATIFIIAVIFIPAMIENLF